MKCSCCGKELTSKDRYCPNCGQNNPDYVKPIEEPKPEPEEQSAPKATYEAPQRPNYAQPPHVVYVERESIAISVLSLVFGLLGGWLGLLFGIIGLCRYKEPGNRGRCIAGIACWAVWVVILLIVTLTR